MVILLQFEKSICSNAHMLKKSSKNKNTLYLWQLIIYTLRAARKNTYLFCHVIESKGESPSTVGSKWMNEWQLIRKYEPIQVMFIWMKVLINLKPLVSQLFAFEFLNLGKKCYITFSWTPLPSSPHSPKLQVYQKMKVLFFNLKDICTVLCFYKCMG